MTISPASLATLLDQVAKGRTINLTASWLASRLGVDHLAAYKLLLNAVDSSSVPGLRRRLMWYCPVERDDCGEYTEVGHLLKADGTSSTYQCRSCKRVHTISLDKALVEFQYTPKAQPSTKGPTTATEVSESGAAAPGFLPVVTSTGARKTVGELKALGIWQQVEGALPANGVGRWLLGGIAFGSLSACGGGGAYLVSLPAVKTWFNALVAGILP